MRPTARAVSHQAGDTAGRQRDMTIRRAQRQLDEFLTSLDVIGNVVYKSKNAEECPPST
jgi:hypothetical protein